MAESSDIQALSLISSEIDESQIKVILSSQCIKAQAFLVDKIRKQLERQQEEYKKISNNNTKLETEIKNAEGEIQSLLTALQTVKSANVELKKELLLAQERKLEQIEYFRSGDIKYEVIWQECRKRFESIPHIQSWMALNNTMKDLKEAVHVLENNATALKTDIKTKTIEVRLMNRKRVVELAKFIIHDIPNGVKVINEKTNDIAKLKAEIADLTKALENTTIKVTFITAPNADKGGQEQIKKQIDDNLPNLYKNVNNETMMVMTTMLNATENILLVDNNLDDYNRQLEIMSHLLPKLHLKNIDLEAFSEKLDQIKKTGHMNMSPQKRYIEPEVKQAQNDVFKKPRLESNFIDKVFSKQNNIVPYNNLAMNDKENRDQDYSKRKLINILEDIKLDSNDTLKMIAEVDPSTLKDVNKIDCNNHSVEPERGNIVDAEKPEVSRDKKAVNESTDSEIIETVNIDITQKIRPPSQFLDATQYSQESNYRKLSQEMSLQKTSGQAPEKSSYENENNVTFNSQLDISSAHEESFVNLKNMLLKKNNLDLSPQFVYAKNTKLQKTEEDYVTSKFFEKETKCTGIRSSVEIIEVIEDKNKPNNTSDTEEKDNIEIAEDNLVTSSPKKQQCTPITEKHVSGFLFNHGSCGIPESLNVSINTTGMEDGDGDYHMPIDTSLLLSPKADISLSVNDGNAEMVQSQEVPNFLLGLRKTGLSFFGRMCTDSAAETSSQNQANSFNFKFGGDNEKKTRGGLFNMFK